MKKADPLISIVLSFYNEENVLPEFLRRTRKVFQDLVKQGAVRSYELIFVNDDSTDGSEKLLRKELEKKDIVLINMSRNFGVSECALAGLKHAAGDAVIYMDVDLQDPPELIPELIKAWRDDPEAEVVYTTRRNREGEHWFKVFFTKIGYRVINLISEIDLKVDSGDFKLLSRRAVDCLLEMKEDKPYLRGMVSWIGFRQVQVFYDRAPRFDGRKNTKFSFLGSRVLDYWFDRALISFSAFPLKMMLFFGFLISFLAIFYILVVFCQKILGMVIPGWTAIMSAVLFLGGVQIMTLGFIGLYIGVIFRESRKRPLYIIKDVIRSD